MNIGRRLQKIIARNKSSTVNLEEILDVREENLWRNALPYSKVPGPRALPVLGNNWRFIPYIGPCQIENIDKVSKDLYAEYGSIVKIDKLFGRPDMLFVFDPDEIEKVFRQEDLMPHRPSMPSLNYYKHVYRKEFFGENPGVIAVHGEKWQKFRSKVNKVMLQPRVTKTYIKPIEATAIEFVERIAKLRDSDNEVPSDFLNELHKWSLESIAKIALDVRLGCLENQANPDTQKMIDAVNTFFINVPILEIRMPFWRILKDPMIYPRFKTYIRALDTIREICVKYIEAALSNTSFKKEVSVLQRVLELDNDTKTAAILALDMFLVGIDTTSNTVASILYQLALHQDKQQALFEELEVVLPCKYTQLDEQKLDQMVYLKACIKENLRKYPVVIGNGRTTTRDMIVGGYHIPKGVQIVFQHCVISNTEKYFTRCNEYLPERWLKSCPFESNDLSKHHPFTSLPFGYGKRMCLGRRFADLEIQTIIAKIIRRYKIEYHHKKLDYYVHPMYTPKGSLKLRFIDRS
ncbi:putative cytochrome P-450 [Trypoxylus dichotomus]